MGRATADDGLAALGMSGAEARQWRFVGGRWLQDDEGVISPPANLVDQNLAFYTAQAYQDFEARFEFRWDVYWTAAGFLFRAQDARHYYLVEFPATGQQTIAEHFWATISKVDERGWKEILHMQMVHGVTSMPRIWHKARLTVQGDEIRLWVDGRPVSAVRDSSYRAGGRVGLLSYSGLGETPGSSFRNLRIGGQAVTAPVWDDSILPGRNWGVVDGKQGAGCGNITRASNGDLLLYSGTRLVRSADNGQSWTADEGPTEAGGGYILRGLPEGGLERYGAVFQPPFKIRKSISANHGRTWTAWREVAEVVFPSDMPFTSFIPCRMLETKGGALLLFAYGQTTWKEEVIGGRIYQAAPLPVLQGYCLRSIDGGESWSAPVNLDGPGVDATTASIEPVIDKNAVEYGDLQFGKGDLNEVSAAQTRDGRILALGRPVISPFMWETWSDDDGRSWTPVTRGPFPMWACTNSMTTTASGVLLIGGRFPGMSVQVSYDDGMSWQCHVIDTCTWANGAMIEIEPDVVLFVYGGWNNVTQLRYQTLRVAPRRLEPGKVVPFEGFQKDPSVSLVPLDLVWRFKPDPQNVGVEQSWFAPQTPDSDWARLRVDCAWNLQGFGSFRGCGWYRLRFTIPDELKRHKQLWLFFGAVDKEAIIYLDGEKVFEHTCAATGLTVEQLWDRPFKIDVQSRIKPGREHLITVQALSSFGHSGIWRPVCLASAPAEVSPYRLLAVLRDRSAR